MKNKLEVMIKNETPLKSRYRSEYRNKSREASHNPPQSSKSPILRYNPKMSSEDENMK